MLRDKNYYWLHIYTLLQQVNEQSLKMKKRKTSITNIRKDAMFTELIDNVMSSYCEYKFKNL